MLFFNVCFLMLLFNVVFQRGGTTQLGTVGQNMGGPRIGGRNTVFTAARCSLKFAAAVRQLWCVGWDRCGLHCVCFMECVVFWNYICKVGVAVFAFP